MTRVSGQKTQNLDNLFICQAFFLNSTFALKHYATPRNSLLCSKAQLIDLLTPGTGKSKFAHL